jgi:hypothetical protein
MILTGEKTDELAKNTFSSATLLLHENLFLRKNFTTEKPAKEKLTFMSPVITQLIRYLYIYIL